nr:MAG TPA: ERp19 reticulum protein 19 (ERp19) family [Caudoviricetes sp.]
MELFKIFGTLAVKGVQDTKKDLSDVSSEAQKTADGTIQNFWNTRCEGCSGY